MKNVKYINITILLIVLSVLGCTLNNSKLKGDSTMEYANAEQLFKAISSGSRAQRNAAVEDLSNAYISTNRNSYQRKLVGMPNQLIVSALSHPYRGNAQAKLWFTTVEILIDELKTEERVPAGVALTHVGMAPFGTNYVAWKAQWPKHKELYIQVMDQKSK